MSISIVINGDCLEAMREIPDKAFDLAIVDPPFGINAGEMRMNNNNHVFKSWDALPPTSEYFTELRRVSENQIIWGGNHFALPASRCFIVWDKKQPEGVSFAMAEMAWASFDSVPKVFYQFPSHVTQGRKIHPTQKPVALYKWLLTNYAKPGGTILDTHLGSGSSRIAAHDLGFDFTGFELDAEYHAAAEERFQRHIAQSNLFECEPVLEAKQESLFTTA